MNFTSLPKRTNNMNRDWNKAKQNKKAHRTEVDFIN